MNSTMGTFEWNDLYNIKNKGLGQSCRMVLAPPTNREKGTEMFETETLAASSVEPGMRLHIGTKTYDPCFAVVRHSAFNEHLNSQVLDTTCGTFEIFWSERVTVDIPVPGQSDDLELLVARYCQAEESWDRLFSTTAEVQPHRSLLDSLNGEMAGLLDAAKLIGGEIQQTYFDTEVIDFDCD